MKGATEYRGIGTLQRTMLSCAICLLFIVSLLSWQTESIPPDLYLDERSGILQRCVSNSSNHLYPYVATIFTCGCIMVVIIGIIMFGGSL